MDKIGCKIDEVRIDGSLDALKRDLEHYRKINIKAVELPVHGLDAIKNGTLDKKQVKKIKEVLRDFDFEYSVHSPNPLNLMDSTNPEIHLYVFRASLEFCMHVGAKILVYHCGRFTPEETFHVNGKKAVSEIEKKGLLERERRYLKQLSEEFPQVTICLENARPYLHHSPYCYGERLENIKKQVEKINRRNVRVTLDVGHLNMASSFYGFDLLKAIRSIRHLIAHTHIHDNFGGAVYHYEKQQTHQIPFGKGDSHMPVGWGSIPVCDIFSILLPHYDGLFIMELRNRYFKHIRESRENLLSVFQEIDAHQKDDSLTLSFSQSEVAL